MKGKPGKTLKSGKGVLLVTGALVGGMLLQTVPSIAESQSTATGISQIKLTYRNDPASSIMVNWRDAANAGDEIVQVMPKKEVNAFDNCGRPDEKECKEVKADGKVVGTNIGPLKFFQAELKDLEPGKEYVYRVGSGKGWSPSYSFKTADGTGEFAVAAGGELHIGDKFQPGWKTMAEAIQKTNPAFMLSMGDNVNTGYNEEEWERFFNQAPSFFATIPFMTAPGNHETYGSFSSGIPSPIFFANFAYPLNGSDKAGRNYSFDYNGVHFVVLEANPTVPLSYIQSEAEWLKKDLEDAVKRTRFQVVLTHSPIYHSKESRVQPNYENPEFRDILVPIFDKYGVDLVMSGHDKHYVRSYPLKGKQMPAGSVPQIGPKIVKPGKGTVYMEISTTGDNYPDFLQQDWMEAAQNKTAVYLSLQMKQDRIEGKAIQADGTVVDQFTILPVKAESPEKDQAEFDNK